MNGSQGIAVGMATNIAPHNGEAVEATCYLIDHPDATVDELIQIMPGPDFPTGALIMGTDGIRQSYETGRGSITVPPRRTSSPPRRAATAWCSPRSRTW